MSSLFNVFVFMFEDILCNSKAITMTFQEKIQYLMQDMNIKEFSNSE